MASLVNSNRRGSFVSTLPGAEENRKLKPLTNKFHTRAFIELKSWALEAESGVGGGLGEFRGGREAEIENEHSLLLLSIYWLFWWISFVANMGSNQKAPTSNFLWYFRDVVYLRNKILLTIRGSLFIYISPPPKTVVMRQFKRKTPGKTHYLTSSGLHSN